MVDTVAVSDQGVRHAAQIEQAIPVGIVARRREISGPSTIPHARATSEVTCANPEHFADPEPDRLKIFIDDGHLFRGPAD
jgi:hypothetical protein